MLSFHHRPLATFPAIRHPTRQSRGARNTVYLAQSCKGDGNNERRINQSRRSLIASVLTTTLLATTQTFSFAAPAAASSSLCTVDAAGGGNQRLSFFRGLLGSSPEAPCGIEEVLESGRAAGGEGEAFRKRRSDEQRRGRERGGEEASSSSSSSFDERAALEEERQRATQDFVESMWQGLE